VDGNARGAGGGLSPPGLTAATSSPADCTAQDRVNGLAVVVAFPFPAPDAVRLQPRFFSGFVLP